MGLESAPVEAQRKPLALLAILATAGGRGISRDRLFLLLWPESNMAHARGALNQTLYTLRRMFGQDIVSGGQSLVLSRSGIACDLWEFEAALEEGRDEEAVALYRGAFLDGVHLPGSLEFDQWAQLERDRVRHLFRLGLERLASAATGTGDHRAAARYWALLSAQDPLASQPVIRLLESLAAAGERAAALDRARAYRELVRRELETDPDPTFEEVAARIAAPLPPEAVMGVAPETGGAPAETRARGSRWWILLLLLALLMPGTALIRQMVMHATPEVETVIAVLPFRSDPVFGGSLAQGIVPLLTASLDGAGDLRGVDPTVVLSRLESAPDPQQAQRMARRLGAELYVTGEIAGAGARIRLRASLHDVAGRSMGQSVAEGDSTELFALVDRLARELVATRSTAHRDRLTRVAAITTTSLPAFKEFLRGERASREDEYGVAADAYQRALALDSTFALAWYRLARSAAWSGRDSLARRALASATRYRDRLTNHDRTLVEAFASWHAGDFDRAELLYRSILDDYPDDLDAATQLGEVLYHGNPLRGRSATEARVPFELAMSLDSTDQETVIHLARVAAMEGRPKDVERLVSQALALGREDIVELRAFRAFALNDPSALARSTRDVLAHATDVDPVSALAVAVRLDDLDGSERFATSLISPRRPGHVRGLGYRMLARAAASRGRFRLAQQYIDESAAFDSTAALELRSLVAVLPFAPADPELLKRVYEELSTWNPLASPPVPQHSQAHAGLHRLIRLHRLGLVLTRMGDTTGALAAAAELEGLSDSGLSGTARTLACSVRAHIAMFRGDPAAALRLLDQAGWPSHAGALESEALDRYTRAEALRMLRKGEEAGEWYATIAQRAAYELVYLAPSQWRLAGIRVAAADSTAARESLRIVLATWPAPEPALRPLTDSAAATLSRLEHQGTMRR